MGATPIPKQPYPLANGQTYYGSPGYFGAGQPITQEIDPLTINTSPYAGSPGYFGYSNPVSGQASNPGAILPVSPGQTIDPNTGQYLNPSTASLAGGVLPAENPAANALMGSPQQLVNPAATGKAGETFTPANPGQTQGITTVSAGQGVNQNYLDKWQPPSLQYGGIQNAQLPNLTFPPQATPPAAKPKDWTSEQNSLISQLGLPTGSVLTPADQQFTGYQLPTNPYGSANYFKNSPNYKLVDPNDPNSGYLWIGSGPQETAGQTVANENAASQYPSNLGLYGANAPTWNQDTGQYDYRNDPLKYIYDANVGQGFQVSLPPPTIPKVREPRVREYFGGGRGW